MPSHFTRRWGRVGVIVLAVAAAGAGAFALAAGSVNPQECNSDDEGTRSQCCYSHYTACYVDCMNQFGGGEKFTKCTMTCWNTYIACRYR